MTKKIMLFHCRQVRLLLAQSVARSARTMRCSGYSKQWASSRSSHGKRPLPLLQSASCYERFWRTRLHKPVQSKSEWNRTQHDSNHASLNSFRFG
jgi:hypothetical protein